jgi:hypothetical protein
MPKIYMLILLAVLLSGVGFIYLSRFGLWLGMAKVPLDVERQASIVSIRRTSTILTPILLGVVVSKIDVQLDSLSVAFNLFMFLLWIAAWLYFQRMPVAYLELIQREGLTISVRRLGLQLLVLICLFYYPWSVTWYPNDALGVMGIIFVMDLVAQSFIVALMLQRRRSLGD